jgi:alkanesulfonate monooxygenase SsuD/methylene tetrahydromethanopterin reductase-like flavin-dependent oxidoreductase (luciferase family)
MCPDNFQFLSYVAAKTKKLKLMTGAVILPWNDPLRVVEKTIMLDIMSEGRMLLGMGRGAARREFAAFRCDMADSREMFDEAAPIIMEGLETGFVEADTKWYKQPRIEVRPRPEKSFKGRTTMVTMSRSSAEVAAKYGLRALRFSQGRWDGAALEEINVYRNTFKQCHDREAPPFYIDDFVICFEDKQKIIHHTDEHFKKLFQAVANHYELGSEHFKSLPSYSVYVTLGEMSAARGGPEKAYKDYIEANLIGTPEEIWEKHLYRRKMVGDYNIVANFSFGGMPYDVVYDQARRFAEKILPKLKG